MEEKKYTSEEVLDLQSAAYQKGYNEGYQLRKQPQPSAVWVRASEPGIKEGEYISKYRKSPNDAWHVGVSVVDATHIHFIEKVSYNIRWQKGHEELHNLFILDESGTAAGREEDAFKKEVIDFIRDIATNWDCDEDGHRYNTGCRKCSASELYFELSKQQKEK